MECKICSHPDGGNHYNTVTCRACAAFFRRSMQMKMTYRCKKNGNCDLDCTISRVNRFSCRYCRLKRCLDIGMEMDEESVGSVECPDTSCVISCSASNSYSDQGDRDRLPSFDSDDDFFTPENVFHDVPTFIKELQYRLHLILDKRPPNSNVPYTRSLCQQAAVAYDKHKEKWPTCTRDKLNHSKTIVLNQVVCDYSKEFEYIGEFCMEIRPFTQLPTDQKNIVMKRFAKKFMSIDQVSTSVRLLGSDPDDSRLISLSGQVCDYRTSTYDCSVISVYTEEFLKGWFVGTEEQFNNLYVKQFKALNPDHFEIMYLLMSAMWEVDDYKYITDKTKEVAAETRRRLAEELNFYYQFEKNLTNYASRIYKLNNLTSALDRIAELKKQDSQVAMTFELCKIDVNLHDLTI